MNLQHKPARLDCPTCGGPCMVIATIDEANTALSVAVTAQERLAACRGLIKAAEREEFRLIKVIADSVSRAPMPPMPPMPMSTVDYARMSQAINRKNKGRTP